MNRRAASPLRVDGKLSAHDFQSLPHAGQAEPGPLFTSWASKPAPESLTVRLMCRVPVQRDLRGLAPPCLTAFSRASCNTR